MTKTIASCEVSSCEMVHYFKFTAKEQREQLARYQAYADSFCKAHGLAKIPVVFNGRVKIALGRFVVRGFSFSIELNKLQAVIAYRRGEDTLLPTLLHELTHYQVYIGGGNFDDGAADFEQALAANNAPSSGATRKAKRSTHAVLEYYTVCDVYRFTTEEGVVKDTKIVEHTTTQAYKGRYLLGAYLVTPKREKAIIEKVQSI